MKILKRGLVLAAMTFASVAALSGSASATLVPNPYSSTTDTGSFTSNTILGPSACSIRGININLRQVTTSPLLIGGSVTGLTVFGCSGAITAASAALVTTLNPIGIQISGGVITLTNVSLLITNSIGGNCLYRGTLTGAYRQGTATRTITARNTAFGGLTRLSGTCSTTADANLTVNLGASIS